jgi:putative ABC transport system substrate-binding protein
MRRREVIQTVIAATLAWSLAAHADQAAVVRQIGYLGIPSAAEQSERIEALRKGLRELGYVEGANISIHYRWAENRYERLPDLAAELVRLNPDVILAHGTPGTRAAMGATTTIPIVAIVVGDLLAPGLVPSLARPGGNLTGQTFFFPEICAKRVELIKEAVSSVSRVAVLLNPDNQAYPMAFAAMERTAQALGLNLVAFEVRTREDLTFAFASMAEREVQAAVVVDDAFLIASAGFIAELALKHRMPVIGEKSHTSGGAFMSYGVDLTAFWFRSATLVHRILKGAQPADLPIQQATKFELIIDLRTAKAFGLAIPPTLLARADEVIE